MFPGSFGPSNPARRSANGRDVDTKRAVAPSLAGNREFIWLANRDGTTSLSEFVNQDADDPLRELTKKVSFEKALALWILLTAGNPDGVEAELANDNPTCPE
jgi:hypothetical protein